MSSGQLSIAGSVVVVTGAASGIGAAIAIGIARVGARVVATDVDGHALEALGDDATGEGLALTTAVVDVTDEASVAGLFSSVLDLEGRVDVVFSNAGIAGPIVPVDELTLADWRRVMAVNADGAFLVARDTTDLPAGHFSG